MKIFAMPIWVLTLSLIAGTSAANGTNSAKYTATNNQATKPLIQTYTWFDGKRERTVYLNPDLIAEFGTSRSTSAVKKMHPQAQEVHGKGATRVWRVDNAPEAMTKLKTTAQPGARYSPVLHDGPSTGHRMRALPGGIIVYLNPQWDQAAVDSWLAANRLEIEKKLEIGPNVYVVKTGPGLEALELANTLVQSGQVVSAVPNWWQETATR